jgi:hypothetical protein
MAIDDDEDWKTIPDWDLEDTTTIEAMSREELELKLQQAAKHLVEGMKLMLSQNERIEYLERTVVMLCEQMQTLHPELKDALDELKTASDV